MVRRMSERLSVHVLDFSICDIAPQLVLVPSSNDPNDKSLCATREHYRLDSSLHNINIDKQLENPYILTHRLLAD